jgi:hypothetical protein
MHTPAINPAFQKSPAHGRNFMSGLAIRPGISLVENASDESSTPVAPVIQTKRFSALARRLLSIHHQSAEP